jgi:hypothetical protein
MFPPQPGTSRQKSQHMVGKKIDKMFIVNFPQAKSKKSTFSTRMAFTAIMVEFMKTCPEA